MSSSSQSLVAAGLSEREAAVWHALATQGPLNVLQIARAIDLNRPAVYTLLSSLTEKGLIETTTQKKRVFYRSRGTKALEAWRSQREQAFGKELKRLQVQEEKEGISVSDDVRVYHGKDIQKVWHEVLKALPRGGVFYRYDGYAPGTPVPSYMPKTFYDDMEQRRLDRFVITNQRLRDSHYKKRLECASHVLPPSVDAFEQGVTQFIFDDQIALIDFTTETAYLIKNKPLAEYHKYLFRFVYQTIEK